MSDASPRPAVFRARRLDVRSAARAFPLVQVFDRDASLTGWVRFVRARARGSKAGVSAIEDCRRYIHAIIVWSVEGHLALRRTLRVSSTLVGALPGLALQEAVVEAVRALAVDLECEAILVEHGDGGGARFREALLASGFAPLAGASFLSRPPNA